MIKNTVVCCSCFIDESVWFVNSVEWSNRLWRFDSFTCVGGLLSDKIFIYKKNPTFVLQDDYSVLHINEIIVCCVKCFEFQLTYLSTREEMIDVFNQIDCRYVTFDSFCFDTDIYIGNDQFMNSNYIHLTSDEREELYHETKRKVGKVSRKKPKRKSCFTSLQKFTYECFYNKCKEIFDIFFLEKLHCFSNKR